MKKYFLSEQFFSSIVLIAIAFIVYLVFKKIFDSYMKNHLKGLNNKKQTYFRLIKNISKYILVVFFVIVFLNINGINVSGMIAGLGVVSAIAGLALQDALKDIIQGFNLIVDDYFSVGDIVTINGVEGKVIEIGLKCTKIKDFKNGGGVYVIANRNISSSSVKGNILAIDLPLSYDLPTQDAEKVINRIVKEVSKIENVKDMEYKGINSFENSYISYKIMGECKPDLQVQVRRDINVLIKNILEEENISIPYNQLDVHIEKQK